MANKSNIIPGMAGDLKKIGLQHGDCVILHSSYKSLGLKNNTPSDVIHTLIHALSPDGTLMMPTFTYSYSGIWDIEPFNVDTTAGKSTGILTEILRKFPGAVRSAHPTCSVAVIGKNAELITNDKEHASPFGRGSSYEVAFNLDAKILLMGVGNNCNSMLHYAEVVANLPYNDIPFRGFWRKTAIVEKDGEIIEVALANEFPACSANFNVVDAYFKEKGIPTYGKILCADSMFMDAQEMIAAVVERLHKEPAWFLCNHSACEPCTLRKRRLQERGLI